MVYTSRNANTNKTVQLNVLQTKFKKPEKSKPLIPNPKFQVRVGLNLGLESQEITNILSGCFSYAKNQNSKYYFSSVPLFSPFFN